MIDNLHAQKPTGYVRKPRRYPHGRVCSHPACDTRLSSYNPLGTCRPHTPVRFPRVRGRIAPDASKA